MTHWPLITRLARAESGQDLVEYALLAAVVGIALVLVMPLLQAAVGGALGGWGDAVYDLWLP
jgi:Flp pilus assembly pilin Flp